MLFLALLFFTAGAVVCAMAKSVAILLLGRCLQGVGGGGLSTMTYVLMADELNLNQRHKGIITVSISWLIGPILGPILSGVFTDRAGWQWIFW